MKIFCKNINKLIINTYKLMRDILINFFCVDKVKINFNMFNLSMKHMVSVKIIKINTKKKLEF